MKILAPALLAAALLAAPAAAPAADPGLAPPVVRKSASKPASTAVPTPDNSSARKAPVANAVARPRPTAAPATSQDFRAALAAGKPPAEGSLDDGLIGVMSRLLAAGRCGEAVNLAASQRQAELAERARQICRTN